MNTLVALALFGGRRLILAGVSRWGIWLAAGFVALGLILALYRYERRIVSKRAGLTLLALRVCAALALVAALFEPIASRTFRETLRGRVILGVDLSESMTTADAGTDRSLSRREAARRLIDGDWIKAIASAHDVEGVGFSRVSTGDASLAALADRLKAPGRPDDPEAQATDWNPVLELGLRDADRPVIGVVLLTDGRDNAGDGSSALADKLAARGVPIYPVLIGSTDRPKDAAIASVRGPERVSKGDVADVEVTLKIDGPPPGTEVAVTLDRPGASPLKKLVKVPADGSRPVANFRVPMDTIGPQTLTTAVGPIDGDVRADNDRRTFPVEVADDTARVLLVDSLARWEFQYLRNALARDPRVKLDSVVFQQPMLPGGDPSYKTALPPKADPSLKERSPDSLGSYDVIILGDVGVEDMNADSWKRLEWYVDARGGTLVLAAGPRLLAAIGTQETARKLLPMIDPRPLSADALRPDPSKPALPPGVAVVPGSSSASEAFPMIRLSAEPEANRSTWAALPRQPWSAYGKAKPLASVLASLDTGEADAAIVAQPYGLGKVLWVGVETWRWRYRVGDLHHHRFWGQVVRWSDAAKLAVGNRLVRHGPTRPRVIEGTGATLRAQFSDDAPDVNPDLLVAARVFKKGADGKTSGDAVAVVPLRPRSDQPRTFEAVAPALNAGSYLIRLDVPQLGADAPSAEAALDVTAPRHDRARRSGREPRRPRPPRLGHRRKSLLRGRRGRAARDPESQDDRPGADRGDVFMGHPLGSHPVLRHPRGRMDLAQEGGIAMTYDQSRMTPRRRRSPQP